MEKILQGLGFGVLGFVFDEPDVSNSFGHFRIDQFQCQNPISGPECVPACETLQLARAMTIK